MSESLVTIASYLYLDDAITARNALDGAGIESFLDDENIVAINWFNAYAVHGVKLRVRNTDALRAAEVLDTRCESLGEIEEADEQLPDPNTCPACGSHDIIRTPRAAVFATLALFSIGLSVMVREGQVAFLAVATFALFMLIWDRQKCAECGESWN